MTVAKLPLRRRWPDVAIFDGAAFEWQDAPDVSPCFDVWIDEAKIPPVEALAVDELGAQPAGGTDVGRCQDRRGSGTIARMMTENKTQVEHVEPEILFEEGKCLVVCKPPGLLTQAPPGIDSIELRIKEFIRARTGKRGQIYLGVPHRLDRPASGVMVFGLNRRAAGRLSEQFEARTVKKTYWACVAGQVEPAQGTWSDHVRKVPEVARAEVVAADHPHGRPAVLHYRLLGNYDWGSWLQIELETGRTHQIRIQAATRGHAVLGDAQYGSTVAFGPQHEDERLRAIALHARTLEFQHPQTKENVSITAPAPDAWGEYTQ